jgi:hypothetical protein
MALGVLKILKEIAPLIVQAGGVAAGLRQSGGTAKTDERVARLEQEAVRAGEVIRAVAEQLQAIAEELRRQAEAVAQAQKRARVLLIVSVVAFVAGSAGLITALAMR